MEVIGILILAAVILVAMVPCTCIAGNAIMKHFGFTSYDVSGCHMLFYGGNAIPEQIFGSYAASRAYMVCRLVKGVASHG